MALASIIAMLLSAVCVDGTPPVILGQTFIAGSLDKLTERSTGWALVSHGIAETLFTFDKHGNLVGQIAQSATKIDDTTWEVTLKSGYKFSDGTALTASHVATAFTFLNTNAEAAQATLGSMTVTAKDATAVKIKSERSTFSIQNVLAEWVFTVFLDKDDGSRIYTGPFKADNFVADEKIECSPNQYYPQAAQRPDITIKLYEDGYKLADALGDGEVDMAFHLPISTLPDLRTVDPPVYIKSFEAGYQYMIFYQLRRSPMSDIKVRQAVDVAIDRTALQQALAGGDATRSLFPEASPWFKDDSSMIGDKAAAEALLDEAGWVLDSADNKRKKGTAGPLTMKVVAYAQRPGLVTMQPLVEKTLTDLGITVTSVTTSADSWDGLDGVLGGNDFDILFYAQNPLAGGDPASFLSSQFRSDGASNWMTKETISGINSAEIDSLLDDVALATEHSDRLVAVEAAHTAILNQYPVSILVTPHWHVGLSSRLSSYEPYGADYYIVHANLFLTSTPAPAASTPETSPTPQTSPTSQPNQEDASGACQVVLSGLLLTCLSLLLPM